ncbi:MAG: DUF1131 family protein [Thiotrichaceae bacterium]|nr:DUF1131 family protein [Thiotrichaceae bacterium]
MKTLNTLALACLSLSLSACNNETDNNSHQEIGKEIKLNQILISRDGIGPINKSMPFNMHQVTKAFPDFSVTEFTQSKKGVTSPVIRVSDEGKPLLIINPDSKQQSIFSIFVRSSRIGNSLGHPVGTQYKKVYPDHREPCTAGTDDFIGKVLCVAPNAHNILYAFAGNNNTNKPATPPLEVLANWHLETIIWRKP